VPPLTLIRNELCQLPICPRDGPFFRKLNCTKYATKYLFVEAGPII
jgi:hypothetical protein